MEKMAKQILIGGFFILSIIVLNVPAYAQDDDTRLTKNIRKTFELSSEGTIDVTNKYGQVIVHTWDKDSVLVDIQITAYGKDDDQVEKLMGRVDFEFDNFGDFLTIETLLDRKSGFFKEMWNNISDYSKSLLSKNKLNIDYELTIPAKAVFNLENKFGDVYVNTLYSSSKLRVSHGDLKANDIRGSTKIYLSFGKANIKQLHDGFIELKGAELDLREGGNLDLESSSSEIEVDNITSMKLNSRNDKFRIENVRFLRGKASFSNIVLHDLGDNLDVDLNYGECDIHRVNENFSAVEINGKSADISLSFDIGSYFALDLFGTEDRIVLSKNLSHLDKRINPEDKDEIYLTGKVGYEKGKLSQVNIKANGGDVYVQVQEAGAITNKGE